MKIAQSVNAKWLANVGISSSIVSAGVGYDVTKGYKVEESYTVSTGGKSYTIVAYPDYRITNFDVYKRSIFKDKKVGSGAAFRPVGSCFVAYRN